MKIIDLHQDLLFHLQGGGGVKAGSQTSVELLEQSQVQVLLGSVFVDPHEQLGQDWLSAVVKEVAGYALMTHEFFTCIKTGADLQPVLSGEMPGLLLHLEGLYWWDDHGTEYYDYLFDCLGLRSLGIVWNEANEYGGGCSAPGVGLTDQGRAVLKWCEERGVIIDLAHMNESTFWDTVQATTGPLIVSHANAAGLRPHVRNLTDDQLWAVASRDGVVGVTFVNGFVVGKGRASVAHVADHIEYIRDTVGLPHVAIGSDFGGILDGGVEGLESVADLPNLWAELARRGWSDEQIEAVAWRNAARLLKQILP